MNKTRDERHICKSTNEIIRRNFFISNGYVYFGNMRSFGVRSVNIL
jgi:hypothetical protein